MNEQMRMEFPSTPETPKPMVIIEAEKAQMLRVEYAIPKDKDIYLGEGEIYYTTDYDGTYITLDKWKARIDALYAPEEGQRKDLN
jgi:hypothetical protein